MSIFSKVAMKKPRSNTFNLSHDKKLSCGMGNLVPITCMEVVPGDKFNVSTSQMIRFSPLLAPIMHNVTCYTHFFFVPNRIVWDGWEEFITGGEDGMSTRVMPTFQFQTADGVRVSNESLADYLGLPTTHGQNVPQQLFQANALPFAAYQMIYNEYYRDQNMIDPVSFDLVDGDNTSNGELVELRQRAWQHDYFTSALPWTQKGAEATLPLGAQAPLGGALDIIHRGKGAGPLMPDVVYDTTGGLSGDGDLEVLASGPGTTGRLNVSGQLPGSVDNSENLDIFTGAAYADLSQATAASINDLRRAFRLQEWLEKNARGGSRYTESLLVHFGVKSSDARLQRPEYLGGGATPVQISEVLQTSAADAQPTPQGNMSGHGLAIGQTPSFSKFFEEHGYIIGIMSIMPKTSYFQGIPKHFLRQDKFDYYWPEFANLGEQPILNKEIYVDQTDGQDDETFGYTPRYSEYKYVNSSVHGEFRSTLDFWHMARKFDDRPALNGDFITSSPTTRIFAVESEDGVGSLWCHVFNKVLANRRMPVFGTPTI